MRRCLEQLRHVVPEQFAAADPARVLACAQSLPDLAGSTHSTRKRTIIGLLAVARSYIRVRVRARPSYEYTRKVQNEVVRCARARLSVSQVRERD